MKPKILPKFAIFILAVIIAGCTSTSNNQNKEININVGTDGLAAEFVKNAPPPRVFQDSNFPVVIKIRNGGVFSIPDGSGYLAIGREKDYIPNFEIERSNNDVKASEEFRDVYTFSVPGKTALNPKGDEILATFTATAAKIDPQSEARTSTISATLCYPYITSFSQTVCIDTDVIGLRSGKKACSVNINGITLTGGQGGPIAVTRIETSMIPKDNLIKPQFLIYVENQGTGQVVDPLSLNKVCGNVALIKEDIRKTWNIAYLKAFISSGNEENQLDCCPNPSPDGQCTGDDKRGIIRLRDKKDFVRCTFPKGIPNSIDSYTSPLRIDLGYGYVQSVPVNFIIQKPITY